MGNRRNSNNTRVDYDYDCQIVFGNCFILNPDFGSLNDPRHLVDRWNNLFEKAKSEEVIYIERKEN